MTEIPFGRPWITDDERNAVLEVLDGPILTHGPQSKSFEEEFSVFVGDGAHCVSVACATAALHLAYLCFGVGPGDEVIVPAMTHAATAHAVEIVGAKPVFVDCEPATGNLTADQVAAAITSHTKVISLVHFVGIPCEMDKIMALADRHHLRVVEDCAIALGTRYQGKHVGLFGDVGCFSFYPVKQITTGEGGMFISRHPEIAEHVAHVRALGVDRTHTERAIPGMYDVTMLGLNYRMSEIEAAMGRVQLRRMNEIFRRRRANFEALLSGLEDIPNIHILRPNTLAASSSYYCMSVILQDTLRLRRNDIVACLRKAGVGTSIYYPHPVPRLTYYRDKYGYDERAYPNAVAISDSSIALPVGPHLSPADMEYIATSFKQAVEEMIPC